MKEIRPVHFVIAMILVLLVLAITQWAKLPQNVPVQSASSVSAVAPAELPRPQSDIERLNAPPPVLEPLPPFEESEEGNGLEPKTATEARRAMV